MKIHVNFFVFSIFLVTSLATVNGQNVSESYPVKVYVGPFNAEFNWNTSNPGIDVLDPKKMKDFNNYEFWINTGQYFDSPLPIERRIVIDIDDYEVAKDVSDEKLKDMLLKKFVPNGENKTVTWDTINITAYPA